MIVKVYRVMHDETKEGPYINKIYGALFNYKHCSSFTHPIPWQDFIEDFDKSYVCGFETKCHFLNWFDQDDIEKLKECDFGLYEIEIDEDYVKYGLKQVVFDIDKAITTKKVS